MTSQVIDTAIFITIAFYGVVPNIIVMIFSQYLIKFVYALLDTPFFYLLTKKVKSKKQNKKEVVAMSNENLKNGVATQFKSGEQAANMGRKGGKASAKKKREKKAMQDITKELLNMAAKSEELTDIEDIQSFAEIRGKNITVQEAITIAIIQKALKGDYKAAEYLRTTAGETPSTKIEFTELPVVIGGEDELED